MNRYYNPPTSVRTHGRLLRPGWFVDLKSQMQDDEVLMALFENQAGALVAAEVPTEERMAELEDVWQPTEFYALPRLEAERGFDRQGT